MDRGNRAVGIALVLALLSVGALLAQDAVVDNSAAFGIWGSNFKGAIIERVSDTYSYSSSTYWSTVTGGETGTQY